MAITVGESASVSIATLISVSDAITVGESSIDIRQLRQVKATDAVTIGESISTQIPVLVSVSDIVIVQTSSLGTYSINVSETATIGEAFSADQFPKEPAIVEPITIGDDPTVNLRSYVNVTEAVTVGEAAQASIAWLPRVTDAITVGDSFSTPITGAAQINVTDAVTVQESSSFYRLAPTTFSFYKILTIRAGEVPSTQSHFAVLLPFIAGDSNLKTVANGGHLQNSSGFDMRPYADAAFTQPLTYELVTGTYDATVGSFEMWVNITAQDGAVIYLAYGNTGCDFDGSLPTTWDSDYQGVFHLANAVGGISVGVDTFGSAPMQPVFNPEVGGTDLNVSDSSAAAVFTPVNHGAMEGVGPVGGVGIFSRVLSQYISLAASSTHDGALTVEAWILVNATGTAMYAVSKGSVTPNTEWSLYYDGTHVAFAANNGATVGVTGSTTLAAHTWYHAVGVYDGSNWKIFLNGASNATQVTTVGPISTAAEHEIGALAVNGTPAQFWDGGIGEVRISNIGRLPDYIATAYNNQSNLTAFWLTGAEINVGTIAATDAITVADVPALSIKSFPALTDAVTITDTAAAMLKSFINVTEALTVGEILNINKIAAGGINVTDAISIGETVSCNIVPILLVALTETITATDTPLLSLKSFIVAVEAVQLDEAITAVVTTPGAALTFDLDELVAVSESSSFSIVSITTVCVPFRRNAVVTVNSRQTTAPVVTVRTEIEPADCEAELVTE